jgi:hypothetical protein
LLKYSLLKPYLIPQQLFSFKIFIYLAAKVNLPLSPAPFFNFYITRSYSRFYEDYQLPLKVSWYLYETFQAKWHRHYKRSVSTRSGNLNFNWFVAVGQSSILSTTDTVTKDISSPLAVIVFGLRLKQFDKAAVRTSCSATALPLSSKPLLYRSWFIFSHPSTLSERFGVFVLFFLNSMLLPFIKVRHC